MLEDKTILSHGVGNSYSGPHASVAGTSLTEPSPSFLVLYVASLLIPLLGIHTDFEI